MQIYLTQKASFNCISEQGAFLLFTSDSFFAKTRSFPSDYHWGWRCLQLLHVSQLLLDCLSNDKLGAIGIHGMGRIGKTTIMHKINNDFLETREFKDLSMIRF
ncbi:hypothetical protein AMTRI_Chr11g156030 [Amborella trichopoda]